jgi:ankyrin repeat protein
MSMFAKKQSYYRVLKLFVHGMLGRSGTDMTLSTDNEEEIKGEMKGKFDTPTTDINSTSKSRVGSIDNLSQNVLHEACLLPRSILLPSDYRVFADNPISYLLCNDASRLEAAARQSKGSINMADEEDASGNFALHLFVSNESYCIVKKLRDINFEEYLLKQLIEYNPSAVFIPNKDHKLPLHLAMKAGRRHAVTKLLTLHPDAVHLDDRMDDPQIFVQLLGCVADVARERNEARASYFSSMFQLIRSRPDICAAGVDWSRRNNARRGRST